MSDRDRDHSQTSGQEQAQGQKPQTEQGGGRRGGRRRHPRQPAQMPRRSESSSSVNMDELRELIEMFTSHGLTEFELENEDIRVRLSRGATPQASAPVQTAQVASQFAPPVAPATESQSAAPPASAQPVASDSTATPSEDLYTITSPIVGTFYRAPSPASDSFVRVGSNVEHDTVVCIIEAMKLMNEIQAEVTGTVEKIYVENGQPVEYGQPLFGIKVK